ncbi:hypothetical protein [Halapricum salinum]|uniref:Uncharacterized protein n=1 Tax=Halapricum salinum TaxID=1457250 RepID=A0A4D6HDX9_9EURY|nr:hypothetical protein [Halapricum salinum]QCC51378.1 hypothetical protein DV733_09035 [Halapricum salinum]
MAVTLPESMLAQYRRFTLFNSPYAEHDDGRAVDLYPESERAPSPVAGTVKAIKRVRAPPKDYAAEEDAMLVIDTGESLARILHVDPVVEEGETVEPGDDLGSLIRAGFFAPWVPNHLHLGFREYGTDPFRASGSLPLDVGAEVRPLAWDGTGTVVETGETWARLDSPAHPDPGEYFVGLESDGGVLDGGLPHYAFGGLLGGGERAEVAGESVGTVEDGVVAWDGVTVLANGEAITGLALFCARGSFGIKLVGEDVDFDVGESVSVSVESFDG